VKQHRILIIGLIAVALTGCAPKPVTPPPAAPPPTAEPTTPAVTIKQFDPGAATWSFIPNAQAESGITVTLVDGKAVIDGVTYTYAPQFTAYADADDDGDLDAATYIGANGGGNTEDGQWYMWLDDDGKFVQVALPIARTIACGTIVDSVTAADVGFTIHEFRRRIDESSLACTDRGSDERIRTVTARPTAAGEVWPVEAAPFEGAFGGVCPTVTTYSGGPVSDPVYGTPNAEGTPVPGSLIIAPVEPWPIYLKHPGWTLALIGDDTHLGCAWIQRP